MEALAGLKMLESGLIRGDGWESASRDDIDWAAESPEREWRADSENESLRKTFGWERRLRFLIQRTRVASISIRSIELQCTVHV